MPRRTARTPRRKEGVRVSVGGGVGGDVQMRDVRCGSGEGKGRTVRR